MSAFSLSFLIVATFLVTVLGTAWLKKWLMERNILDYPGERTSHEVPTPRGGGLVIYLVLVAVWIILISKSANLPTEALWILVCSVGLVIPAWIDDLGQVSSMSRLLGQIVIVIIAMFFLTGPFPVFQGVLPTALDAPATVFLWVGFTNLFNFTDGIDGNAATKAMVLGFGVFALSIFGEIPSGLGELGITAAAAAAGFLVWNWHPARIFMGDVGSIPLGFLLGWLLLSLATRGQWAPALILPLIYLADSGLTYTGKITRREKFWRPHRDLYYQHAARSPGVTHADVVKVILLGDLVLVGLAILSAQGMISLSLIGATVTSVTVIIYLKVGFRQ
jgi:UDP-N-acetylmuramyl pentapeptide phosphotransferase/UDP-N-acetylglucosamine-1-phosphate transferase